MSSNGSCRSESESGDEGEGDAYENVVPAGDDKNGVDGYRSGDTMENVDGQIADGTGCHIVNGEAGLSSGASDGIDYVELDFTERQLMEKDAAENEYNSHDDKDQFSETDTDHVGELEKSTEHESQADGDAAKESIAPTIVFVNPPTIPDIPSDNGNVVGNGAASIEVDSRFTPGGKTSVSLLSQPAGYTNGQNMISSENTLISGISNGAPPESSNAYYSNVTTHQELVDRGFIVVHPPGSSLMNNVPSGKTNIPTSYAKNMPILGTSDATAHGRIYQPNGGSRVISNGHATVVRIGAGGIVNGGVANVYRPTLPQNGATLEKIRQAAHNGGATIVTIDTHRKAGKVGVLILSMCLLFTIAMQGPNVHTTEQTPIHLITWIVVC